jgi:hypothetical protein
MPNGKKRMDVKEFRAKQRRKVAQPPLMFASWFYGCIEMNEDRVCKLVRVGEVKDLVKLGLFPTPSMPDW